MNATLESVAAGAAATAAALVVLRICEAAGMGPWLLRLGGG